MVSLASPSSLEKVVKAPFFKQLRPPVVPIQRLPSRSSKIFQMSPPVSPSFCENVVSFPSTKRARPSAVPIQRAPARSLKSEITELLSSPSLVLKQLVLWPLIRHRPLALVPTQIFPFWSTSTARMSSLGRQCKGITATNLPQANLLRPLCVPIQSVPRLSPVMENTELSASPSVLVK